MWQYQLHPPHLISVATLSCKTQNYENVILQRDITKENCIRWSQFDHETDDHETTQSVKLTCTGNTISHDTNSRNNGIQSCELTCDSDSKSTRSGRVSDDAVSRWRQIKGAWSTSDAATAPIMWLCSADVCRKKVAGNIDCWGWFAAVVNVSLCWAKNNKHNWLMDVHKEKKGKERKSIHIALFCQGGTLKALRHGSHSFTCK